jgi:hypothetical protein
VFAWAPGVPGIIVSLALLGVGWGLFNPSVLGILSVQAADAEQGAGRALPRQLGELVGGGYHQVRQ